MYGWQCQKYLNTEGAWYIYIVKLCLREPAVRIIILALIADVHWCSRLYLETNTVQGTLNPLYKPYLTP